MSHSQGRATLPGTIRAVLMACTSVVGFSAASPVAQAQTPWVLVWSDEFSGTTLNTSNWEIQIGTGTSSGLPAGWGNNEQQFYSGRPQNLSVSNGTLKITALRDFYSGSTYSSARIRSLNKFATQYGRIEASIIIPSGSGIWPAFWMLPTGSPYGGWAASGEIDVMESTNTADGIYGTIHYGGQWPANTSNGGYYSPAGTNFASRAYLYAVEWEPDEMRWYVDGVLYHTANSNLWFSSNATSNNRAPFDVPFHLLLNVAVGGNFPGQPNGTGFPMTMTVDYVRVYQRQQVPFSTQPAPIPGLVEAENYDLGGTGVAYLDADTSNNGNQYRTNEFVDIENCIEGGFNVGWIRQGEWIEYAVNVETPGTYRAQARVAAQTGGGSFRLEFGGVNRTGTMVAPATGGWQTWTTVSATATLPAGQSTMRFFVESGSTTQFNLNSFNFVLLVQAGDVNADQELDLDDLYAFEQGQGQYRDVDLDGTPGTAADRVSLLATLRAGEPNAQ